MFELSRISHRVLVPAEYLLWQQLYSYGQYKKNI